MPTDWTAFPLTSPVKQKKKKSVQASIISYYQAAQKFTVHGRVMHLIDSLFFCGHMSFSFRIIILYGHFVSHIFFSPSPCLSLFIHDRCSFACTKIFQRQCNQSYFGRHFLNGTALMLLVNLIFELLLHRSNQTWHTFMTSAEVC